MMENLYADFASIISKRWKLQCNDFNTIGQIASQIFGSAANGNTPRVTAVKNAYSLYFIQDCTDKTKYCINFDLLAIDAPELLGLQNKELPNNDKNPIENIQKAINDEIAATREHNRSNPIGGKYLSVSDLGIVGNYYEVILQLDDEEEIPFPEGVSLTMRWGRDGTWLNAKLLTSTQDKAIIETERSLTDQEKLFPFVLIPQTDQLLISLQESLASRYTSSSTIANRLLTRSIAPNSLVWESEIVTSNTDEFQKATITQCLKKDITFVWGPPGTGKTHTMARLIVSLVLSGKRVLVSSIANVAVDQLARQVVSTLLSVGYLGEKLLSDGRALRFGYAVLPEVYQEKRLFPNREEAQVILQIINEINSDLKNQKSLTSEQKARMMKEKSFLQKSLKDLTSSYLNNAAVVFTTAVQTCLEPSFAEMLFDTVIVDEASMMPLPYLINLATFTNERLVIAGDYKQLGPIVLSTSLTSRRWMHKDIFSYLELDKVDTHQSLCMLKIQRRMDPKICSLINRHFYNSELKNQFTEGAEPGLTLLPAPGMPVVRIHSRGLSERTKSKSRINETNASLIVNLVIYYLKSHKSIKIGVITPYRGQSLLIKSKLKKITSTLSDSDTKRVSIGTVHAFQGSEANVIIWDLVESIKMKIGRLFLNNTGQRLANVAISRAQCKLVIVGDLTPFENGVSNDVGTILGRFFSNNRSSVVQSESLLTDIKLEEAS